MFSERHLVKTFIVYLNFSEVEVSVMFGKEGRLKKKLILKTDIIIIFAVKLV